LTFGNQKSQYIIGKMTLRQEVPHLPGNELQQRYRPREKQKQEG